jgi:hypothetical protein
MSKAKTSHEDLTHFVERLVDRRDDCLRAAEEARKAGNHMLAFTYTDRAEAFVEALYTLKLWSRGEYGQSLDEQKA